MTSTTHGSSEIETYIGKIADPNVDLPAKCTAAANLKELLDSLRDPDNARVLTYIPPAVLELLRSCPPSNSKDSIEFKLRKELLEIFLRLPTSEHIRPHVPDIFTGLINLLRVDNEENGIASCKVMLDFVRHYRVLTDENMTNFSAIFHQLVEGYQSLVDHLISEDAVMEDPSILRLSTKSFKVLAEIGLVMVLFSQITRPNITPLLKENILLALQTAQYEPPVQKAAREAFESSGGLWSGMAPKISNPTAYLDNLSAQTKLISFAIFVLRWQADQFEAHGDQLVQCALRLLQDCPSHAVALRKELMVVFRHLINTPHRRVLIEHLDKFLDENVLLGPSLTSREVLRTLVYSTVSDLIHHLRQDNYPNVTPAQLSKMVHTYSSLLQMPSLPSNLHVLFAKLLSGLVDPIVTRDTSQGAMRLLNFINETYLTRLQALSVVVEDLATRIGSQSQDQSLSRTVTIVENARPASRAHYATERPEDILQECRLIYRALLSGFRFTFVGLRKLDAPLPDGSAMNRIFQSSIRCIFHYDADPRNTELTNDLVDFLAPVLLETHPHVFQQVWISNIEFFFERATKKITLLSLCSALFTREQSCATLVAIVLNFLAENLALLGEYEDLTAATMIRLYKLAFNSVTTFPQTVEPVLASHLGKLLMDCFPLASKATRPSHYFHLLRALFRAIGGGGGRLELLYKEVLPLLPDMLDNLNRHLQSAESPTREMVVELCLTVPLRLTHLLPHLSYLMKPLAFALRGNPELVAQGLRTLELCIDNLTPDFLDPTLDIVLRELTEALHSHLRPLPSPHMPAHHAMRILGKMGGRNRKLLYKPISLKHQHHSKAAALSISFGGSTQSIALEPILALAVRVLRRPSGPERATTERGYAYSLLEVGLSTLILNGINSENEIQSFISALHGLYDCLFSSDTQVKADGFLQKLAKDLVSNEIPAQLPSSKDLHIPPCQPILSALIDSFPYLLAREQKSELDVAIASLSSIVKLIVTVLGQRNVVSPKIMPVLHQITNKFLAMCHEDDWTTKNAGCAGIQLMIDTPLVNVVWVSEREADLLRGLLHVLKDLPHEQPRDPSAMVEALITIVHMSNTGDRKVADARKHQDKLKGLVGFFFSELQSASPIVRAAAQKCIECIVSMDGRSVTEILLPHRDRLLSGIFTKPLRALPFLIQIGMIESVRYCVALEPPLVEMNDELLRMLHECLALADADDSQLVPRANARQGALEVVKLRVACIKLLTASMPMTDFFARQPQTRQRVTGVYFKSLYSSSRDVKDAAYEGLKMVLAHQSRLPRELLQTGLRPILMNLADPKRLSIPGLEGLARLLELLTNYFKVEIGHKLLDHFRVVADAQMLQQSARLPLSENEGIIKLVRLANIFHLLPSAANIFLEQLVNQIVQTEAQLQCAGSSPFSEPLAKYLDRYHEEGVTFFLNHLHFPRHLRTLRNILQARLAPNLEAELISRIPALVDQYLKDGDSSHILAVLSLFSDLVEMDSSLFSLYPSIIEVLSEIWRSQTSSAQIPFGTDLAQRSSMLISVFVSALRHEPRIDLIFELIPVYRIQQGLDTVQLTHFLYDHVAANPSLSFRRNVLFQFVVWFSRADISWADKANFVHFIITPILVVHASGGGEPSHLINEGFSAQVLRIIWKPLADATLSPRVEEGLICELLHFTGVMVRYYGTLLDAAKKDIIRCASNFEANEDAIIKQTAFLLSARFYEAFPSPNKFLLRSWTGLLRMSPSDGRPHLRLEALSILAPCLASAPDAADTPQWATTAHKMMTEEGGSQIIAMYQVITREPALFYPVRAMFLPHMAGSLNKLGLSTTSTPESRTLSVEMLEVMFDWEVKARDDSQPSTWTASLTLRENMVSYLIRLASVYQELPSKPQYSSRILSLLKRMVGPSGWPDVTFGLRFFVRALEQNDISSESNLALAVSTAKVLELIAMDQKDDWYEKHGEILSRLIQKGIISDDALLHETLYGIFNRLANLYPLPKEDEEPHAELSNFHNFVYTNIGENLRNMTNLSSTLAMLKSIVLVNPERIDTFCTPLIKGYNKLAKDHISSAPTQANFDAVAKLLITILEICQLAMSYLGDVRRQVLSGLLVLADKSRSLPLCQYLLDLARGWAMGKQDPYPTMKEKAGFLHKMACFESRGEPLFNAYLELIYDIYTEPSLRRSDLTSRLEQSFLLGCRARDAAIRERFLQLLDASIPCSLMNRLVYILAVQSWDALADHNWIYLAGHLLMGAIDQDLPSSEKRATASELVRPKPELFVEQLRRLLFNDTQAAHECWVSLFPAAWSCLSRREQMEVTQHMINLLAKDFHTRQADLRPNAIQSLLQGVYVAHPQMTLPAHLVKYLAKTFNAWHVGIEILNTSLDHLHLHRDDDNVRDTLYDSLADLYGELAEEDVYYGLSRRRSLHPETNLALSLEQNGFWQEAATLYETAQSRAKASAIPFTESEYCLWEDHWVLAQQKLEQWELLNDLAKNDNENDLFLETAWRLMDWSSSTDQDTIEKHVAMLPEAPTPRRRIFETFLTLLKLPSAPEKSAEFTKLIEEAIQLSLRKWSSLPTDLSLAHITLLQHFQQFVELQESVSVYGSLAQTNAQNLEKKSSELKVVLQTWRERLPDIFDDIGIWSDLVAWRQNVFKSINSAYLPLIPPSSSNGATSNSNTFGYRGYHETAWIINRFAHTARKHDLLDVCQTSLTKIYQLPNIEISEAFLKLREQARCHYQKREELQAGLEVINNTNLIFFSMPQKAEFYTLKGMFHSRCSRKEDANSAFSQAVQMDMHNPKAWAEWGKHNDRLFKENPADLTLAANAVSCYLQAAGEFKNAKSRPLLARVLWLLGLDDSALTISRAFDTHKGDAAYWYWITLVPQLCQSISHRESRQARFLLVNLAKHYPQALFYHLRTTREELMTVKRQLEARALQPPQTGGDVTMRDVNGADDTNPAATISRASSDALEDVVQALKTSFPLLILSMETMVDQFISKVSPKSPPKDEELYRNLYLVLQDACSTYMVRMAEQDEHLPIAAPTVNLLTRFQSSEPVKNTPEVAKEFQNAKQLPLLDYIRLLQKWRDEYERRLDLRPQFQSLDTLSHHLTQFQYTKVDEIEVPGQYTEDKDNNQNFVRIRKFGHKFENCRSNGMSWKRITIHGSDYSKVYFLVQSPIRGHPRREEKAIQLFRSFNIPLLSKKESRKRNLQFHLPAVISFNSQLRLYQSDPTSFTLGDVFDLHCEERGMGREDPLLASGDKVKRVIRELKSRKSGGPLKSEYLDLKKQIMDEISKKMVPDDILSRFMVRITDGPYNLWRMRKQFTQQLSLAHFMTFTICLSSRHPHRFTVSRSTGQITMTELLPGLSSASPVHQTHDIVPFRYTPNMQKFVGPIFTDGIMTSCMLSIGRCLTDPGFDLESHLSLFCRDEIIWWMIGRQQRNAPPPPPDQPLRQLVTQSAEAITKRAEVVACKVERDQLAQGFTLQQPIVQSITQLISSATDPMKIVKLGEIYFPWF